MTTIGIILTLTSIIGGFFAARKIRTYITTAHTTTPQPQPQDYTQPAPQPEPPQHVFEVGKTYNGTEVVWVCKRNYIAVEGRRELRLGVEGTFDITAKDEHAIEGIAHIEGEDTFFRVGYGVYEDHECAVFYDGRNFGFDATDIINQ